MMAITCVNCERGYQRIENGIFLVEMFCSPPEPYKVWSADLWQCPNCKDKVVSGRGDNPLMHHFQDGFSEYLAELRASKCCTVIREYE